MVSGTYVRERKYGLGRKRVRARNLADARESSSGGEGERPRRQLGQALQRRPNLELAANSFKHCVGEFGRAGVAPEVWSLGPSPDGLERRLIDRP